MEQLVLYAQAGTHAPAGMWYDIVSDTMTADNKLSRSLRSYASSPYMQNTKSTTQNGTL
jgi:hypothetical protein